MAAVTRKDLDKEIQKLDSIHKVDIKNLNDSLKNYKAELQHAHVRDRMMEKTCSSYVNNAENIYKTHAEIAERTYNASLEMHKTSWSHLTWSIGIIATLVAAIAIGSIIKGVRQKIIQWIASYFDKDIKERIEKELKQAYEEIDDTKNKINKQSIEVYQQMEYSIELLALKIDIANLSSNNDAINTGEQIYLIAEQLNKHFPLLPIEIDIIKTGDQFLWKTEKIKSYITKTTDAYSNAIAYILKIDSNLKNKSYAVSLIKKALEFFLKLHHTDLLQETNRLDEIIDNINKIEKTMFSIDGQTQIQMNLSDDQKITLLIKKIRNLLNQLNNISPQLLRVIDELKQGKFNPHV